MREIKFRAWKKSQQRMVEWLEMSEMVSLHDILSGVYLEAVMQYTGLKDKNGVEIWESDLIQRGSGIAKQIGPVIFDRGCFLMEAIGEIPWPASDGPSRVRFVLSAFESEIEVIGNIYQDARLLESEK